MIELEITIIKKNIAKTRDILNFIDQNIGAINKRGYVVVFQFAKGKGSFPELKIDGTSYVGVSTIKNTINKLINQNTLIDAFSDSPNQGESFLKEQMLNLVGSPGDEDEHDDEALTNDKIRARTEAINSSRSNRWDPSGIKIMDEQKKEKKTKNKKGLNVDQNNSSAGQTFGAKGQAPIPNDDVLSKMMAGKLDL